MNWEIKIISKTLMTKISHISWGVTTKGVTKKRGYDKGFYGNIFSDCGHVFIFYDSSSIFSAFWSSIFANWEITFISRKTKNN